MNKPIYKKKVDWSYIKKLKYGKIEEFTPNKTKIINLCGYVRKKECIDCKKPTIKFNRCKECYYKHMGWKKSHLFDKPKGGNKCISTIADEGLEILTDSNRRFSSGSAGKFKFPNSITKTLNHSERD